MRSPGRLILLSGIILTGLSQEGFIQVGDQLAGYRVWDAAGNATKSRAKIVKKKHELFMVKPQYNVKIFINLKFLLLIDPSPYPSPQRGEGKGEGVIHLSFYT